MPILDYRHLAARLPRPSRLLRSYVPLFTAALLLLLVGCASPAETEASASQIEPTASQIEPIDPQAEPVTSSQSETTTAQAATTAPSGAGCITSTETHSLIPTLVPSDSGQATQWKVHQLVLNASQAYANPYTDVVVTATFNGPDGEQQTIRGFWNGGSEFVVRFTPTSAGDWSYSVTSEPADMGLAQSGSFSASPASPAETGFLRRDPAHPYSFVYDNGDRYFMMGQTYYDVMRTACAGERWQEGVLKSNEYGINKIRIFVHSLGFGPDHLHPDFYPAEYVFEDDDHDQLNIDYWKRLDEVVIFLAEQGMVADLIMFMRPYNTEDELAFGTQEQDERYARYVLARYAAFPNVIWCLSNEWEFTGKDQPYWDAMGELVRNEDPWMMQGDAHRLLSIHHATGGKQGGKFTFFNSSWPVHAIVQYGVRNARFENGDEWANYSIVENHGRGMPVVNDEYGYIGETEPVNLTREQHRRALWAITVGGGYGSVGDSRIFNDGPNGEPGRVIMTGHWHEAEEYEDVRHVVDFWTTQDIPYWQMMPQNSLITNGERAYVLANEGEEYVIYAATGGEITIELPDGNYSVQQYDPRTGTSSTMDEVVGGGSVSLSLPDSNDWVLYLSRSAS